MASRRLAGRGSTPACDTSIRSVLRFTVLPLSIRFLIQRGSGASLRCRKKIGRWPRI